MVTQGAPLRGDPGLRCLTASRYCRNGRALSILTGRAQSRWLSTAVRRFPHPKTLENARRLVDGVRADGIGWKQVWAVHASQAWGIADERRPSSAGTIGTATSRNLSTDVRRSGGQRSHDVLCEPAPSGGFTGGGIRCCRIRARAWRHWCRTACSVRPNWAAIARQGVPCKYNSPISFSSAVRSCHATARASFAIVNCAGS